MYDSTDVRATLVASAPPPSADEYAAAEYEKFYEQEPVIVEEGRRSWYARGQNFVVEYSQVDGECQLSREDQPDEYVLLLPDGGVTATVTTPQESVEVAGQHMVVVPPGQSSITLRGSGTAVRLVTSQSTDLTSLASNAASYEQPHPNVAPWEPWPEPVDGYRVRAYDMTVPPLENSTFRLFRCTTFMVNCFAASTGARDPERLSPHSHDDFEQCSLVFAGDYVHHLRWPWTTRKSTWREDDHEACNGPSVTVIPPRVEHTSQSIGDGLHHMFDVFSPPRADFSAKPGWVFNAEEYPAP